MPTSEARRRTPAGTAFLSGRFEAYRKSSAVVMGLLHELSPLVEQLSIDEAYVDLAADPRHDLSTVGVRRLGTALLSRITEATGGLTASAGIGSSKLMAKIGSELDKPGGLTVIAAGTELEVLHPLPVTRLGGVGPATADRLRPLGIATVADLARVHRGDLVSIFGTAHGDGLYRLARALDDRPVVAERETKSVSAEETFDVDITDRALLAAELQSLSRRVAERLAKSGTFGRTVTLKARRHDFSTLTRSVTLGQATVDAKTIAATAGRLLDALDVSEGLRLLGVGVSGLTTHTQDELLPSERSDTVAPEGDPQRSAPAPTGWRAGQDVTHASYGAGWVWGSGLGRVTVRFEGPKTPPGLVRTFAAADPALRPADPPDWW